MNRQHSNRSYEPSSIITFLHGWPHYTKSFARYDPHPKEVVEDPGTWGETVQVIAIFLSLLSCIYLLVDFITRCYSCFFRSKHPITDKHYQRRRIAAYVMAGVALAAAAVAAKTSGDVTGHVHTVIHSMEDTLTSHEEIIASAHVLLVRINTGHTLLTDIIATHQLPASLQQRATETQQQLRVALTDAHTMLSQSPNVTEITDMADQLTEVNKHRGWATAAILFACALTMALLLGTAHFSRRKAKCYCPLQLLAILFFCVTWAAAAMTVALSVGVADVCMEPQAYTTEVAAHHASKFEQGLLNYYLECLPEAVNPLSERVISAGDTLAVTRVGIAQLETYASYQHLSILPMIQQLQGNMTIADVELSALLVLLDCGRVHNNYYDAVDTICHDFTSSFFVLALFVAAVSLFVATFRGCLPARKPPPAADDTTAFHAMSEDDDDDDYDHQAEEGYEEERPNTAFFSKKENSTGGGNGTSSSPSSLVSSRYSSSPSRMVTPSSPRITMPTAGSPTLSRFHSSSARSTSGSTHAIMSSSPHDHAAYVYLPSVVNDDE